MQLDAIDRQIIQATQAGLPLVAEPYLALAESLGLTATEVMQRLTAMLDGGVIRRIGAVPNHYRLGYKHNGMTVWDVDDAEIDRLGAAVAALSFVSHCYRRPRHLPLRPTTLAGTRGVRSTRRFASRCVRNVKRRKKARRARVSARHRRCKRVFVWLCVHSRWFAQASIDCSIESTAMFQGS